MMHRIIVSIMCLITLQCHASSLWISLGESCTIAQQIELYALNNAYYPFDWNLTLTVNSIIYALENRFEHFFASENLICKDNQLIHDTLYDIFLVHDFPIEQKVAHDGSMYCAIVDNWRDFIDQVRQKYLRRVQRFLDLNNYSGKLIFVRYNCAQESVLALKKVLTDCFSMHPDLTLIIINPVSLQKDHAHIDGVIYYCISTEDMVFPGNAHVFKKLFDGVTHALQ